jgi:phosphatidylserine/phosphatidylglycerophosphate/cardiolipin synthase-like enzyme
MPDAGAAWLLDRIRAARTRVFAKIYLLTDTRFVDALKQAKNNGATVRVMVEPDPYGATEIAKTTLRQLRAAGLEVKEANPTFRYTHEKSYVIDDTAIILTANATRSAFSRNREFAVIARDTADVTEIAATFLADWNRDIPQLNRANLAWSPVSSRAKLDAFVASAQHTLDVYVLTLADERMVATLRSAAQRGVRVRIIASPPSRTDGEDSDTVGLSEVERGGGFTRLITQPFIHAKVLVVDGASAYVGSANLSTTSLDYNRELGIFFNDAVALATLAKTFEQDWAKAKER